ncbi:uncharacterized protein LOC129572311 [Sitodiplosis mosellana]|uniref:uncharacterized protein LOC129572311 n=1 Tax=Sitodiplosis mosellana TaxID=263140 RepID=UPI002444A0E0|nr:uncharacterized protein LOC129572311 [Sitodiplosis mosellana]
MTERGIAVYTTDKYTRLNFDKYVRANSVTDSIAGMLTNHQPSLMHFGAAQMSPSSRMIRSYKKCPGCVVNMVDECNAAINERVKQTKDEAREAETVFLEKEAEEGNGNPAVGNDVPHPDQLNPDLLPKVTIYHKTWRVNGLGNLEYVKFNSAGEMEFVEPRVHKTKWHRDIAAAKCILIKGHCDLFGYMLSETL